MPLGSLGGGTRSGVLKLLFEGRQQRLQRIGGIETQSRRLCPKGFRRLLNLDEIPVQNVIPTTH